MPGAVADAPPAEEFSLAHLGIQDADPCAGFVAKHDFDAWQWYDAEGREHPPPDGDKLAVENSFTYAGVSSSSCLPTFQFICTRLAGACCVLIVTMIGAASCAASSPLV